MKKKAILMEFDILDVLSESQQLFVGDFDRMKDIKKELDDIWKKEETALWQRFGDMKILELDYEKAYDRVS